MGGEGGRGACSRRVTLQYSRSELESSAPSYASRDLKVADDDDDHVRKISGLTLVALRYTDGRPPGARKFAISMENAQEGVWLLVISLSYPRQILSNICVQWPSRARDACAKTPVPRRDFPPFLRAPLMTFSSKGLFHFDPNDWR